MFLPEPSPGRSPIPNATERNDLNRCSWGSGDEFRAKKELIAARKETSCAKALPWASFPALLQVRAGSDMSTFEDLGKVDIPEIQHADFD